VKQERPVPSYMWPCVVDIIAATSRLGRHAHASTIITGVPTSELGTQPIKVWGTVEKALQLVRCVFHKYLFQSDFISSTHHQEEWH
jgi:hypothetical protein